MNFVQVLDVIAPVLKWVSCGVLYFCFSLVIMYLRYMKDIHGEPLDQDPIPSVQRSPHASSSSDGDNGTDKAAPHLPELEQPAPEIFEFSTDEY